MPTCLQPSATYVAEPGNPNGIREGWLAEAADDMTFPGLNRYVGRSTTAVWGVQQSSMYDCVSDCEGRGKTFSTAGTGKLKEAAVLAVPVPQPCGGIGEATGGTVAFSGIEASVPLPSAFCANSAVNLGLINTSISFSGSGLPCQSFGFRSWGGTACLVGHPLPPADGIFICQELGPIPNCSAGDCDNLCGAYALSSQWEVTYPNSTTVQITAFLVVRRTTFFPEFGDCSCTNSSFRFFFHVGPWAGDSTPNGVYANQETGLAEWHWVGGTANVSLQFP